MNPEAKEILDRILTKGLPELTKFDKKFLRARRSYLTEEQAEKYKSILKLTPKGPVKEDGKTQKTNQ